MKERSIIFSAPMVRAILEGRKTQTRRVAKVTAEWCKDGFISPLAGHTPRLIADHAVYCPYGQPGDRLWVRESFCDDWKDERGVQYKADGGLDADMFDAGCKWRSPIHMPRLASRLTLEVTGVRVERLQEISEADAIKEGVDAVSLSDVPRQATMSRRADFKQLWESIHGPGSWEANPWVWCVSFVRIN